MLRFTRYGMTLSKNGVISVKLSKTSLKDYGNIKPFNSYRYASSRNYTTKVRDINRQVLEKPSRDKENVKLGSCSVPGSPCPAPDLNKKLPFRPQLSKPILTQKENENINKNQQVLAKDSTKSCPPNEPPQKPPSPPWLLIGSAIAAAAGGLAWYLLTQEEPTVPQPEPKPVPPAQRIPVNAADIPKEIPYLLIGGGTASFTAFRAIKSHEPTAKVLVISNETDVPYMRPPLSKEMWFNSDSIASEKLRFKQWNGAERSLFYEPADFYVDSAELLKLPNGGVSVCRGWSVVKIDVDQHKVILDDGTEIKYGKCLIATGATPKNLDVFEAASQPVKQRISFYKNVDDFQRLKKNLDKLESIAIIGGGFLGSELSCALAYYSREKKLKVHQLFHESGNMAKVLPEYLSKWTMERVQEEGVNVISNAQIKSAEVFEKKLKLVLTDGRVVVVDHAIVAVGSEPNIKLADSSKLEVDSNLGGFLVNAELEARNGVFAAGDVACFYDVQLGRRRVEHHDHAIVSGRLAGENMVGLHKPYTHQSMFWSDLGPKVGYEAIGIVDAKLETTAVFAKSNEHDTPVAANMDEKLQAGESRVETKVDATETDAPKVAEQAKVAPTKKNDDYGKGVIFYLKDGRVVGVLLWNLFNRINIARRIIASDTKYEDLNEVAKLFDIHDQSFENKSA